MVIGVLTTVPAVPLARNQPSRPVPDFVVVLDKLCGLGNIGTIVRTCHAFGINTVISTTDSIDLFHRKTVDASRATVFATNCIFLPSTSDTVRYLHDNNFQVVTTGLYGSHVQSMVHSAEKPAALIVGNETNGASIENAENSILETFTDAEKKRS